MKCLFSSAVILFAVAISSAQMGPPRPGPEAKNLSYFVGEWSSEGDMKPTDFGPGGKMTMNEQNERMAGGFFVIRHSTFSSNMGRGTGLAIMGYDADEKVYTFDEYNSMGETEHSRGAFDGDTWTWTSEPRMGGSVLKGKFTVKVLSPTSYTFKYEMSPDGKSWTTTMEGKATKTK